MRVAAIVLVMCAMLLTVARAATPAPVTAAEKEAANGVIKQLYNAYASRDLEKILALSHQFIEANALAYEKTHGAGTGEKIRDAYRGDIDDVITHEQYVLKPLQLADVQYRREGDLVVVASAVPIIATGYVTIPGVGRVRLAISKFSLKKTAAGWRIEQMDLRG